MTTQACREVIHPRAIPHDTVICELPEWHEGDHQGLTVVGGLMVTWSDPRPVDISEPCWCCGKVNE